MRSALQKFLLTSLTLLLMGAGVLHAANLSVSVGPKNPPATNEADDGVGVEVLQFALTASSGNVTVSSIVVRADGTINDRSDTENPGVHLVYDANNNGFYDSEGDVLVGSVRYSGDNGYCQFTGLSLIIPSGQTRNYLIAYDLDGGARNNETFRCRLNSSSDITCDAVTKSGSFPVYGNWKTVRTWLGGPGNLILNLGNDNPGDSSEPNNATSLEMLQLTAGVSTREDITLNSVTITGSGTLHEANDISAVKLIRDDNSDGTYQAGETQIGSAGVYSADNGTVTFSGLSYSMSAGSVENWLVVYDLNGSASMGETFVSSLASTANVSGTGRSTYTSITISGSGPYTGGTKTVSSTGSVAISLGDNTPATSNEANDAEGIEVLQLALEVGEVENVKITDVVFTASGTADDRSVSSGGDIAAGGVRLYMDANNNGEFDSSVDPQLGSPGNYNANDGTVSFTGLNRVISAGASENWLLVYDLGGSASNGETFIARIAASGDITAQGVDSGVAITPSGAPVTSNAVSISAVGSLTLAAGPNNPGASNEDDDAHGLEMLQLSCTASSVEDIRITSFRFTANGTANDSSDLENPGVFLYEDTNADGIYDTGDTVVGEGKRYSADNGTVTWSSTTGWTIPAGTTKYYLLVYDLDGGARNDETFYARVAQSSHIVASGVTSSVSITPSGAPVSGGVKTIDREGTVTVSEGANNPAASTEPNDAQGVEMIQLKLATSSAEDMIVSSITFTASGSGHDLNDVALVALYNDTNSNGVFEPGTDTQIGSSGSIAGDNGTITFSGFNYTIPASSTENWLLVYNLNGTASNNETFRVSYSANNNMTVRGLWSYGGSVTSAPVDGGYKTITNVGTMTLSAGASNPSASNELNSATDIEVLQLNLAANATEAVTVSSVTFTATGTIDDRAVTTGDIAATGVRLYYDANANGLYDSGTDTALGSAGNYSADNGTITFSGFTRTIPASSGENWLLVYSLGGSASTGETFSAKLANNTDVTTLGVTSGQAVNILGAPVNGGAKTIQSVGSLTVSLGANTPEDSGQEDDADGVEVLQIALTASSVENISVTSLTLTASGTADDRGGTGDLDNSVGLKLYRDADGDGLVGTGDTLLSSADGYATDDGTRTFYINETVNAGSTRNLLVVYDLDGSGRNGETFISRVAANSDITASGVTSGASITAAGAPIQSSTVTISSAGTLTVAAGAQNSTSPLGNTVEQNDASNVEMLQFTVSASSAEDINVNSVSFSISGTGDDSADVTAGSVRLYRDNGTTAGAYDTGDTQLGSAQSWSADNGYVTFSGSPLRQIAADGTDTWLLVMSFAGSAVNARTFKASLAGNSSITAESGGWWPMGDITITGAPVEGGTKTIEATGTLALSAGDNNPAAGNELSDADDVETLQVKLSAGPNENVKVTQLVLHAATQSGGDNTDIDDVSLYLDVNANGVFESGTDTAIATGGAFSADNGVVTFSGLSEIINADSDESWLVVYDFNANATDGEQYQAQVGVSDITAEGAATTNSITPTGSTVSGGVKTVTQEGTLTCQIGASTPVAANEASDADGVRIIQLKLTADDIENITVSSIVFTDTGSNSGDLSSEFEAARLYLDSNGDGLPTGEVQIGSLAALSGSTMTFSGLSEVVDAGASENWLLVVDLSASATVGDTFRATISSAASINVSSSTTNAAAGTFPVQGNLLTVSATPTLTVALGAQTPSAANVANDESDVEMLQVALSASSAGDITVSGITFTASGTADDLNDVTSFSISLYLDNGSNAGIFDGSDTLISSGGSFSSNNGTVSFSGLSQTISASATVKWLLVMALDGSASGGETFAVSVASTGAVTVATGDVSGSFPVQGSSMTVSDVGSLTVTTGDSNPVSSTIDSDTQDVEVLQIKLIASASENISVTSIVFAASGTADDRSNSSGGDLADSGVSLYRDSNNNGVLDGDPLIASGNFNADNGTVTFSSLTEVINSGSSENWLLVYDLDSITPTAANDETFVASLTAAANVSATGTVSAQSITPSGAFPIGGNAMTVSSVGALSMTAGSSNPAAATISNSVENKAMLRLALTANETENIQITSATFTALGTADDVVDITSGSIELYNDCGTLAGAYDSGDTLISGGGSFSADNGTVTFSSLTEVIDAGTTENWLIVYDLAGTASASETFSVKVSDNSSIVATGVTSSVSITPSGAPVTGGTMTVSSNAVLTVEAAANNPDETTEFNNASDLSVIRVALTASNSGSNINISSIAFAASGTGDDAADIVANSIELYNDAGTTPGVYDAGDTLISGNGSFNADNGTVTFGGLSETINDNTSENWLVIVDLNGTASDGEAFRVRINDPASDISATEDGSAPGLSISGSAVYGGTKTITSVESVVWAGGDSTFWSVSSNWTPEVVPGASISVTVPDASGTTNDPSVTDETEAKNLTVDSGGILNMSSGGSLTLYESSSVSGSINMNAGSTLIMNDGITLNVTGSVAMTGSGWASGQYATMKSSGSGSYFNVSFSGGVDLDYARFENLSTSGLVLSGSSGATVSANNVRVYNIQTGGTCVTISGSDWGNSQTFAGWGFENVSGDGEVTVCISNGATVLFSEYETASGWLFGEDTDYDQNGLVMWSATDAFVTDFAAYSSEKGMDIRWKTATEMNNMGFKVYRSRLTEDGSVPRFNPRKPSLCWNALKADIIRGATGSVMEQKYELVDDRVEPGVEYAYVLVDVDVVGNPSRAFNPVSVAYRGKRVREKPEPTWSAMIDEAFFPDDMPLSKIGKSLFEDGIFGAAASITGDDVLRVASTVNSIVTPGMKIVPDLPSMSGAESRGLATRGARRFGSSRSRRSTEQPSIDLGRKGESATPKPHRNQTTPFGNENGGNTWKGKSWVADVPGWQDAIRQITLVALQRRLAIAQRLSAGGGGIGTDDEVDAGDIEGEADDITDVVDEIIDDGELPTRDNGLVVIPTTPGHTVPEVPVQPERELTLDELRIGNVARIETVEKGLYRLKVDELVSCGFNPDKRFVLLCGGEEVPMWAVASEAGDGRDLCFYAAERKTLYSKVNVYWLWQIDDEPRVMQQDLPVPVAAVGQGETLATVHYEDNSTYQGNLPGSTGEDDHFFCSAYAMAMSGSAMGANFSLDCKGLVAGSAGKVRMKLHSFSDTSPSSHVKLVVNGTTVGEWQWNRAQRYQLEAVVPASALKESGNVVTLLPVADIPGILEAEFVDWVELDYRTTASATEDRAEFVMDSGATCAKISGFGAEASVIAVNVENPYSPVRAECVSVAAGVDSAEVKFVGTSGAPYSVSALSALREPYSIQTMAPLRTAAEISCDYLVIYLDSLKESALKYAAYRSSRGLNVEAVALSEALDVGNYGFYGPEAIKIFIADVSPKYVLLLGDMTFDYFGLYGDDAKYSIPAPFVVTHDYHTVSDYDLGGYASGVAIGRIPARSDAEAEVVLAKVMAREASAAYASDMLLVADNAMDHFRESCEQAAILATGTVNKAYMSDMPVADVKPNILSAWNAGPWAVYFSGHGSRDDWTASKVFGVSAMSGLSEQAVSPLVIQLDCLSSMAWYPRFSGYGCLGEALLMTEGKGASSVIGSTGMTAPKSQTEMANIIISSLKSGKTLGEALANAQAQLSSSGGDYEVIRSFLLLGDPAGK